jgi:glycine cleavage system H protein
MYFTKDHEWVTIEHDIATVGITDYAQKALGDVVYVELPVVGKSLIKGENTAVVESVKAASEVYAPLSGTITAINQDIIDNPALVNSNPQDAAWFFKMSLSKHDEVDGLMDGAAYQEMVK